MERTSDLNGCGSQCAAQNGAGHLLHRLDIYTIEIKPEDADVVLPDADVATWNHA